MYSIKEIKHHFGVLHLGVIIIIIKKIPSAIEDATTAKSIYINRSPQNQHLQRNKHQKKQKELRKNIAMQFRSLFVIKTPLKSPELS